jgi:hypothetical protein
MPGFIPGIHALFFLDRSRHAKREGVDGGNKCGHDE